jgi:hypothetical protein
MAKRKEPLNDKKSFNDLLLILKNNTLMPLARTDKKSRTYIK